MGIRLTKMNYTSFCSIVCCLHLWNVDNMPAHRCRCNKAAIREVLQFVSIDIRPFFLLSSPDGCHGSSTVIYPVKVGAHDLTVVIKPAFAGRALGPRDAGVGHENVETTVEFLENGLDGTFDFLGLLDVDLVCFGCLRLSQPANTIL